MGDVFKEYCQPIYSYLRRCLLEIFRSIKSLSTVLRAFCPMFSLSRRLHLMTLANFWALLLSHLQIHNQWRNSSPKSLMNLLPGVQTCSISECSQCLMVPRSSIRFWGHTCPLTLSSDMYYTKWNSIGIQVELTWLYT